ncbi:MAG: hypothetical protein ACKVJK_24155 [Methylophagaceae bacterium]
MKMTDLINKAPLPPTTAAPMTGTNTGGVPSTQQAPANTATAQAATTPGQTFDPAARNKQIQDQRKALDVQIKQMQAQLKSLQQQKATLR